MNQTKEAIKIRKQLEWLLDHNQEERRVVVWCRHCNTTENLMAGTALTAWLNPFHSEAPCKPGMRNPFRK